MRLWAVLTFGAALCGCAGFSPDGGFGPVAAAGRAELGLDAAWPRSDDDRARRDARVAELLARPLGVDDAVQIALLNNHALQAEFQELGVAEADLVQSGRLPNPRFTLRHSSGGGLYDIEDTVTLSVASLATAPYRHGTAKRRFARTQAGAVVQIVQLADLTRTAYFTALAARESLRYAGQVNAAAQTGAELARRMRDAGNWNALDQARQRSFYLQAQQQLARAQLADETATSELDRLLGLDARTGPALLAGHLPDLPRQIAESADLEQTAMDHRLDLRMMRAETDELARRLKLTKATRIVNVLDAGPTRVRNGTREAPLESGYEVSLEVPIFDTGDARVKRSEALYAQSVERLAQSAVDARAEVREAALRYRTAFETAVRQRDEVLPLRELISNQDLLRYNASLVSVFDLLADAREEIAGVVASMESVRDFWIAKSHLDAVLIANLPR